MSWWNAEPGTWDYDKGRELYEELKYDDLPEEDPKPKPILRQPTEEELYNCGCMVCRIDGWEKCKAMTYQEHEDRIQRFEDYAS